MSDLRDQMREAIVANDGGALTSRQLTAVLNAQLAIPAIADAVALQRLCAPLTIEQVARALEMAAQSVDLGWFPTDDERALLAWEDKR